MASLMSFPNRLVVGVFLFTSIFHHVSALSAEYCSSINTAETPGNYSIFQSNGLCYGFCLQNYAFAILQDHTCWCSNEAPGITTVISDCSFICPGYPDDLCGNPGEDLFGYLALAKSPTTTGDGGSNTVAASTTTDPVTVTVTQSANTYTTTMTPSTSSTFTTSSSATTDTTSSASNPNTTSSSSSESSSSTSTSTWTPTPVTSLETVTGQIRTVTVTPTVPPNSQSVTGVSKKTGSSGLSTGGAVGLTVGLVALVALVSSIVFFCWRRRQKEKGAVESDSSSQRGSSAGLGGPIPSRTMSENSRYVLGTDGRQVVETWEPDNRNAPGSRRSRLMPVDPRLDPFAPVYQRGENKSRESVNTIRDDHDYSRRVHQQAPILRATNPDG